MVPSVESLLGGVVVMSAPDLPSLCQCLIDAWNLRSSSFDQPFLIAIDSIASPCRQPLELSDLDRCMTRLAELTAMIMQEEEVAPPPIKRQQVERKLMQVRQTFLQRLLCVLLDFIRISPQTLVLLTNHVTQSSESLNYQQQQGPASLNDITFSGLAVRPSLGDFFSPLQGSLQQQLSVSGIFSHAEQPYQRLLLEFHLPGAPQFFQTLESNTLQVSEISELWKEAALASIRNLNSAISPQLIDKLAQPCDSSPFFSALLEQYQHSSVTLPLPLALAMSSHIPVLRTATLIPAFASAHRSKRAPFKLCVEGTRTIPTGK